MKRVGSGYFIMLTIYICSGGVRNTFKRFCGMYFCSNECNTSRRKYKFHNVSQIVSFFTLYQTILFTMASPYQKPFNKNLNSRVSTTLQQETSSYSSTAIRLSQQASAFNINGYSTPQEKADDTWNRCHKVVENNCLQLAGCRYHELTSEGAKRELYEKLLLFQRNATEFSIESLHPQESHSDEIPSPELTVEENQKIPQLQLLRALENAHFERLQKTYPQPKFDTATEGLCLNLLLLPHDADINLTAPLPSTKSSYTVKQPDTIINPLYSLFSIPQYTAYENYCMTLGYVPEDPVFNSQTYSQIYCKNPLF